MGSHLPRTGSSFASFMISPRYTTIPHMRGRMKMFRIVAPRHWLPVTVGIFHSFHLVGQRQLGNTFADSRERGADMARFSFVQRDPISDDDLAELDKIGHGPH